MARAPPSFSDVGAELWQSFSHLVNLACTAPCVQKCAQEHDGTIIVGAPSEHPVKPVKLDGNWKDILLGKYQINMGRDGVLGEGTFCVCRSGRLAKTGEAVAIKRYKFNDCSFSIASHDACALKHERAVAVMEKLHEPFHRPSDPKLWNAQLDNVKPANLFMSLLDYSRDQNGKAGYDAKDDELYLVTELAEQSLKDYLQKRKHADSPLSKETVRSTAKAIILVMAGLHAKGLVHLDMKPENLMVFDGRLKLIDVDGCVPFGTKISLRDDSISFSPCYCAPEWAGFVLDREGTGIAATPGLDVWSVGCTICELVTLDAIMRPTYKEFVDPDKRLGRGRFMDWLANLREAPLPNAVQVFDTELVQFMTGCLLVCHESKRSTCAESLDTPYLSSDKMRRTKSSPIRVHANEN